MRRLTRGHIEKFLTKYSTDQSVLDIGAGDTLYSEIFPNRIRLDVDPARNPDVVGDIHELPFPDGTFDVVVCSEVFEHVQNPVKAVSEVSRVLKENGLLVLTTRFIYPVHDAPGDYWRYTPYTMRMLLAGWDILEIQAEARPFMTIAVLLQRLIFQTKMRGGKITKGLILWLAIFISKLDFLITVQYGDITRKDTVDFLMSSGIYVAARKKAALKS